MGRGIPFECSERHIGGNIVIRRNTEYLKVKGTSFATTYLDLQKYNAK